MKKTRFTDNDIVATLKEAEIGITVLSSESQEESDAIVESSFAKITAQIMSLKHHCFMTQQR